MSTPYHELDWQSQDELFFHWLDQYCEAKGLPTFAQAGDYGHVDIVHLRQEFEAQQETGK